MQTQQPVAACDRHGRVHLSGATSRRIDDAGASTLAGVSPVISGPTIGDDHLQRYRSLLMQRLDQRGRALRFVQHRNDDRQRGGRVGGILAQRTQGLSPKAETISGSATRAPGSPRLRPKPSV